MTYNICDITRKFRLQFKISALVGILLYCSVTTWAASEVFLYYDEDYGFNADGWGDWNSTQKIEDAVMAELDEAKIASVVGDADAFVAYMEENPEGVIVSPIVVPEIVYTIGMPDDSPIENFLYGGGVLIYSGDTPFYAVGKKGAPGQKIVPGNQGVMDVLNFTAQYITTTAAAVKPTPEGEKLIPSLEPFNPSRPAQLKVLEAENCDPIEVYAEAGNSADPVLFASPDMKGYFVHFHMEALAGKPADYLEQVGLEIGELITNRFGELLAVEPQGKLTTTWGKLKSLK
jgi:hypothetical protein